MYIYGIIWNGVTATSLRLKATCHRFDDPYGKTLAKEQQGYRPMVGNFVT